jgi:DNA modification methylase
LIRSLIQTSRPADYLLVRADCSQRLILPDRSIIRQWLPLADQSVQCVVTSPPYWQLRDYFVAGQIGLEATLEEYIQIIVEVFRDVRRVLRNDGVLWLNMGDSFNDYNGKAGPGGNWDRVNSRKSKNRPQRDTGHGLTSKALKPKDMMGVPWRVALALQADGWYLRRDIIWHKLAPQRESVRDRPITSHEYLFLFAKSRRYFYDHIAVRKPDKGRDHRRAAARPVERSGGLFRPQSQLICAESRNGHGANLGSVWPLGSEGYRGEHFATFPTKLIVPCIKAGTSEKGCCPDCGAPWKRILERVPISSASPEAPHFPAGWQAGTGRRHDEKIGRHELPIANRDPRRVVTVERAVGWRPGCDHDLEPVPCTVLDPFDGHGTTIVVSLALKRRAIGLELSAKYLKDARRRIERPHAPPRRPVKEEFLPLFDRTIHTNGNGHGATE